MADRIASPDDLRRARERARVAMDLRSGGKDFRVTVHMGTCGIAAGAKEVLTGFANALEEARAGNVTLTRSGCLGLCDQEPLVTVADKTGNEFRYAKLDGDRARRIVAEHLMKDKPIVDWLVKE